MTTKGDSPPEIIIKNETDWVTAKINKYQKGHKRDDK